MKRSRNSAFSLVEVTLALGVAAFCLIAIFGLLPVGVNSNRNSIEQTAAAGVARAIVADLRASSTANKVTPLSPPETRIFKIPLPLSGTHTVFLKESGEMSGGTDQDASAAANPRYRATIYFTASAGKKATPLRLLITWPALTDPTAASTPSKYAGSFETVTALDLN